MKSKLFKTVLPAFALIIAISASLAFTPVENTEEEDTKYNIAFYQVIDENTCIEIADVQCTDVFNTNGFCCVTISGIVYRVYLVDYSIGKCNITLFKCDPQ